MPLMRILFAWTWLFALSVTAQELPDRDWHLRVPLGLSIGANFAKLTTLSGPPFSQGIGAAVALDAGVSLTRREHWGVAVEGGGFLDTYTFSAQGASYAIGLFSWRAHGRAFLLFPLSSELGTDLHFGLGYGFTFYTTDTLKSTSGPIEAVSGSIDRTTPYLMPEIGISSAIGRHRMDLLLRYQVHLLDGPSLSTTLSTTTSSSIATGSGDNLALVLRFSPGFKEKALPKLPMPPGPHTGRINDTLATFPTGRTRVTLTIWDNAEQDGDTLSVLVNDQVVLAGYALSHRKKKVKMRLDRGLNTIIIVAHNEGRVPPNTASCTLRTGRGKKQLLLRTSLKENDVIRILRE